MESQDRRPGRAAQGRFSSRAGVLLAVMTGLPAAAQEQPAEEQFKKACGICHSVDLNAPARQGPHLWGIYGRAAGQTPGFKYSDALAKAELVWNEETLDRWLTNSGQLVPGTTMMYRQRDPEKRQQIISYLKTLGPAAAQSR
jgi:cytochrome c